MTNDQTLYLRPPVWALLLAVVLGGSFYVYGKNQENVDRTPAMISVSGEAKVSVAPDIAQLSLGVQTGRQRTSKEAIDLLARNMTAIVDAVKGAGIPEKDIITEQLSMYPSYDYANGRQTLVGYEASQSLRVKVRDLDKTAEVLGAATGAGANQVGGVQFTIDDPEAVRATAREEAIKEAQAKAEVLADQLGMQLGKIRAFNEGGYGGGPMPPTYMRAEAGMDATNQAAPPLPAGEQELTVNVSITYELR